jgi:hypothetical protein
VVVAVGVAIVVGGALAVVLVLVLVLVLLGMLRRQRYSFCGFQGESGAGGGLFSGVWGWARSFPLDVVVEESVRDVAKFVSGLYVVWLPTCSARRSDVIGLVERAKE